MSTPTTDRAAISEQALQQPTFCAAFQLTAEAYGDEPAHRYDDGSVAFTWSEYAERVRTLAGALASLGVQRGDCVGILLANRVEFALVDLATMHLGATPFSIYHTNPASQIVPLLENSGARVVVTEQAFLERIVESQQTHPGLEHIVVVDGEAPEGGITLADLEARPAPDGFDFDATWKGLDGNDVVTLVYTSGTTGQPKGVQHTHDTIMASCRSMNVHRPFTAGGRTVSYLPNAHIAERFISYYCSLVFGLTITWCPDPKKLAPTLALTKPTRLFGVPRIYEKLQAGAEKMLAGDPDLDHGVVREKLGVSEAEWIGVAAAPSAESMLEFFPTIGVHLIEFWGMSECILSIVPPWDKPKVGSIGDAAPGVEIELADDGEILVRGPNLMIGYRGEPEKTAEAIDADGWLHSGDIGQRDDDGYIKIIDRKKEIIINSAGKNMSPTKIELAVSQQSDLIAQVVAIGDRRPFIGALVVLDPDAAAAKASELGLEADDIAGVAASDEVKAAVAEAVDKGNAMLARVEQVREHAILGETWAPGSEVLTPTQKLKRRPINERYAAEIDELYSRS